MGVGGLRVPQLADGLALHAHRHLRALYLKVLVGVPADDRHPLRVVALRIELHWLLAGHLGADAVGLALARLCGSLLRTAAVGLLVDGGLRVLDARGLLPQLLVAQREHLLLAEVQAQLVRVLGMKPLAAAAENLALQLLYQMVQLLDVGVLGGDDGGLVGYHSVLLGYHGILLGYHGILAGNHAAQAIDNPGAALLRDVLAADASIRRRQVLYVLLAGHCRVVSCMLQRYEKIPTYASLPVLISVILTYCMLKRFLLAAEGLTPSMNSTSSSHLRA